MRLILLIKLSLSLNLRGIFWGAAYVKLDLKGPGHKHRVVFSGDLGATYATLLASPIKPARSRYFSH
jgi:metallo-beta-lactamase family protein